MKNAILIIFIISSCLSHAQIQQDVNLNNFTTESQSTQDIDSIRFNNQNQMGIILRNGSVLIYDFSNVENVTFSIDLYPPGTVHCSGTPTIINDVTNPVTGATWMDRNFGASQVAQSSTDPNAYGSLFQWGRRADGHQCRNSSTTTVLSSSDDPGHGDFILPSSGSFDWRNPQNNDLWQGLNGINNPCPTGYRLPTEAELNSELTSWNSNNAAGGFASPLKLTLGGHRNRSSGQLLGVGTMGFYWTSTVSGSNSRRLTIENNNASMMDTNRSSGRSVRCIQDGL